MSSPSKSTRTSLGAIYSAETWCARPRKTCRRASREAAVQVLAVLRDDKCCSGAKGRHAHDRHRRDPAGESVVSSSLIKRTAAAIDEYSPPWMPAIEQRCGPSAAPCASKHGSSTPARASASKRIVRRSIRRRGLPARPRGCAPAAARSRRSDRRPSGRRLALQAPDPRSCRSAPGRSGSAGGSGSRSAARSGSADRRRPRAPSSGLRIQARDRAQQGLRVGMSRIAKSSAVGAVSTMRPRYITATRSQTWRTTARSWAMNSIVRPSLARRSSSRLSTVACTDTSSAETGSSARSRSGSSASARAMLTRCRCPPESCAGRRSSARGRRPTSSSSSPSGRRPVARHHVVDAQELAKRLPDRHAGLSDE